MGDYVEELGHEKAIKLLKKLKGHWEVTPAVLGKDLNN